MPEPVSIPTIESVHQDQYNLIWKELPYEWWDALVFPTANVVVNPKGDDVQRQQVTIEGDPRGGTYKIAFNGETTEEIKRYSQLYEIQAALEALSTIGSGNITVSYVEAETDPTVVDDNLLDFYFDFDISIPLPTAVVVDVDKLIPYGSVWAKVAYTLGIPIAIFKRELLLMPPMRSVDEAWDYALDLVARNVGTEREEGETDTWLREKVRFAIFLHHIDPFSIPDILKAFAWYAGIYKKNINWLTEYYPYFKGYNNRNPFWPYENISGIGKDLPAYILVTFPWTMGDQWHEDQWLLIGDPGTNSIQTLTISGAPTGGTFTITIGGQETAPIAFDATALDIRIELEALSTVDDGDVAVAGTGPFTLKFMGQYANQVVALATADGTGLTGGTSPSAAIVETRAGATSAFPWQPNVNVSNTPKVVHGHHLLLNFMDLADIISLAGVKCRLFGHGFSLSGTQAGAFPWQAGVNPDRRITGFLELRSNDNIDFTDIPNTYNHHSEPEGGLVINDNNNIAQITKTLNLLADGYETGQRVLKYHAGAKTGGYLWP